MSSSIFFTELLIAQNTTESTPANSIQLPVEKLSIPTGPIWFYSSVSLFLLFVFYAIYSNKKLKQAQKSLRFETFKTKELQKKIKLALVTIKKMETNPDLIHSREFNLDYLRMRMDEEVFHFTIVNLIKVRVKDLITVALRPGSAGNTIGIANTSGRQIKETFDVTYETESRGVRTERVLFRIQIRLTKLPTQSTSSTVGQIIDCIEKFLGSDEDRENWQPTIQGRIIAIHWDQKAKPTPLLVLETREGGNVTMRNSRHQNLLNKARPQNKSIKQKKQTIKR